MEPGNGAAAKIGIAGLLWLVAAGAGAQQATFDAGSGVATLPAVKVGSATYVNVQLALINAANYTFRLVSATPQQPAGAAAITFDAGTGVLTIPSIAVGSAAYSVTLQLTEPSTYTFVLATAVPVAPVAWTFKQIQDNVFTPICARCHDGTQPPGGQLPESQNLTEGNSYANIVNVASLERPDLLRIKPGDPTNSYLVRKLQGGNILGQRMPFGGPYLDQATIDQIKAWVSAGAPNN